MQNIFIMYYIFILSDVSNLNKVSLLVCPTALSSVLAFQKFLDFFQHLLDIGIFRMKGNCRLQNKGTRDALLNIKMLRNLRTRDVTGYECII